MLKIRLQRTGRKHDPSYRVVLVDSRNATNSGSWKEILGTYDARKGEPKFSGEKIKEWIKKGAQPSGSVNNLLVKYKIIAGKTVNVTPSVKKAAAAAEAATLVASAAPAATSGDVKEKAEEAKEKEAETPAEEKPAEA